MGVDDVHEETGSGVGVTTGSLARKLGISPTTLRSWDRRYGLGPASRVEGRHRRWTAEDVAMVHEMCRLTARGVPPAEAARTAKAHATGTPDAPLPPALPSHAPDEETRRRCRGLARAAVRLDVRAVHEQITTAIAAYGLIGAWEEVLTPALRLVGRRWESSKDRYVEVEHLLSWHISVALRESYARSALAVRGEPVDTRPALLACLPGEQHTLPLEALTAALAERGRAVLMLGGAVPVEAVEATVRRVGPAVVALWSQSRSTADLPLARHLAAIRWGIPGARTRSRVLLCGPGWGSHTGSGLPRPTGLRDAVRAVLAAGGADAGPRAAGSGGGAESA
ncbi:MerR family transcriptional regulator [Streptomyces sp. B93]|uniref:MerR family transcriptional regulator n=1 Tax=Streptomyces sp. B93 TaxID=2824875 RepID=UPI001B36E5C0|nr:MerR family transcriptional regulator [Streptomyces sp. B93]MBQ1089928.1 MerR family transcriptional regulator [Streptomyces sp. B93]